MSFLTLFFCLIYSREQGIAVYITKVVSRNLSKIREEWNNIKSNYKFLQDLIDFNKCTYSYKNSKVYVTIDS